MSWQNPKTEEEHVRLCKNFYQNVVKERIYEKEYSKYYKYVEYMFARCPLCEFYLREFNFYYCGKCFLPHRSDLTECYLYNNWHDGKNISAAKEIVKLCEKRLKEIKHNGGKNELAISKN